MLNNLITHDQAYKLLHTLFLTTNVLIYLVVMLLISFTIKFLVLLTKHFLK